MPTLLLDAGTGIRKVTPLLDGRPFCGTILLTHLHWDHVQGLPFFGGGDREDARVKLLLPTQHAPGRDDRKRADGEEAESVLAEMMSPPHFPIRPRALRGAWTFGTVDPGQLELHDNDPETGRDGQQCGPSGQRFSVDIAEVPHKGGRTFGYRVDGGHSVLTYIFGHCAADYAVELGRRARVGRVLLFHHRPDRTDEALDGLARRFAGASVHVAVAAEGSVLEL